MAEDDSTDSSGYRYTGGRISSGILEAVEQGNQVAIADFAEMAAKHLRAMADHYMQGSDDVADVLVPILDKPEPEILLTVRSEKLPQHPGQVSFPGGAVDSADRSAISTALREAEEEIGLDFSQVSPLGFIDRLDTISDYRVLPVVGLVDPAFTWTPNEHEVAEVFTIPMRLAINYDAYTHHEYVHHGVRGKTSSLHWQGHVIWGITASILLNLGRRMGDWVEKK